MLFATKKMIGRRDEEEERNGSITFAPFRYFFPLRREADASFPRVNVGEWGSERRSEQSSDKGNHGMEGGKTVETRLVAVPPIHRHGNQSETERRGGCPLSRAGDEGHFEVFFTTINNPERTSFLSKL